MDSLDPQLTLIRNSGIQGFGVMTPLFSRSGQRGADHDVDPTVREDPKNPHIYGSHYFASSVSGSRFNGGTDPIVTVRETARCRSTSLVTSNQLVAFDWFWRL
jgi:hypothetical protein